MTKTKIERLKAIKEEFANTQARLMTIRKLEESAESSNLSNLLENDLEQAELVLAAQDIMNKLQNISEDLAKMNAHDLFPLVDRMKGAFGPEASHTFEMSANEAVTKAMQTVRHAKDELGSAILRLEGKYPNDMSMDQAPEPEPTDMETDGTDDTDTASVEDVNAAMDDFGGADAASGPKEEPLGRARKESVESEKTLIKESTILETAGRKLLETEGLESLVDWLLTEAASSMPAEKFRSFSKQVAVRAAEDPAKLAGWIGKKRHGIAAMAQLAQPTFTASPELSIVESIEEGKTWRKGDRHSQDQDKADRFLKRNDDRRRKNNSDLEEVTNEGKTFKRNPEDDEDDTDNWQKKKFAKELKRTRRDKHGDLDESHQFIADKIAEMISFNIRSTGKGNTAKVMEMFANTFTDVAALNESNGDLTLVDIFESVYGMKPAQFSILKLKEFMSPLSSNDKKVAAGAMAKLAGTMATDKSASTRPVASALSKLTGQERTVANKMMQSMKSNGQNPTKLGDFAAGASSMIDDNDEDGSNNQMDQSKDAMESVQENINAAHWPTDTAGQYKGEPFQTDYGKLKTAPKTAKTEKAKEETPVPKKETKPKEDADKSSKSSDEAVTSKEPPEKQESQEVKESASEMKMFKVECRMINAQNKTVTGKMKVQARDKNEAKAKAKQSYSKKGNKSVEALSACEA